MAPASFTQLKTSAQARPTISSSGAPIMSAKALLAHTMREPSDCTQTPSSIASMSVLHAPGDVSTPVCEVGCAGSDDSSFVVIFYWACQPPSLRVSSIRFLPSNSLASSTRLDRYFETHIEIGLLTHEIGIFPQSVWDIPHLENLSSGFEPLPAALILLARMLRCPAAQIRQGVIEMITLKTVDSSDHGASVANEGVDASYAIIVSEWDADAFHRRVSELELQGYVVRRETYRVTPETNPETGRIVHLHTVELYVAAWFDEKKNSCRCARSCVEHRAGATAEFCARECAIIPTLLESVADLISKTALAVDEGRK